MSSAFSPSSSRLLLAAVRNPANNLATARNNLIASETGQEKSKGNAKGAADVRDQNLNDLVDIVVTIQR